MAMVLFAVAKHQGRSSHFLPASVLLEGIIPQTLKMNASTLAGDAEKQTHVLAKAAFCSKRKQKAAKKKGHRGGIPGTSWGQESN